jgi:hypothetical protein
MPLGMLLTLFIEDWTVFICQNLFESRIARRIQYHVPVLERREIKPRSIASGAGNTKSSTKTHANAEETFLVNSSNHPLLLDILLKRVASLHATDRPEAYAASPQFISPR